MLCNLVEDMLSYWSDARDSILVMKARMAEINSQLTTLDNMFTWKGMVGITGHGVLGGGGSGSATGGIVHVGCGGGGSVSATSCMNASP